jgi:hypothetical protein
MEKQKSPQFPFYYRDWLHAVRRWTAEDKIEYLEMLCEQADHETGSIPESIFNDECNTEKVRGKFELDANGYFNVVLRRHLTKRNKYKQSRLDNLKGSNPEPHMEPHMDNDKDNDKKEIRTKPLNFPWTDELFMNQWQAWKDYRAEMKIKKYVPTGEQMALTKLKNDSGDNMKVAIAIIHQSMAQGYQGLFPLKGNGPVQSETTNRPSRKKL